jgi:hypothetical protein
MAIKLMLDPSQPRPSFLPDSNAEKELAELGKTAVEVAGDYIGAIYKHAVEQIATTVPADYMKVWTKEFVLTVPAVWSDKAKDLTMQV